MVGDESKFINIFPKNSEHVIYGDNNKGKIVGVGKIGTNLSTSTKKMFYLLMVLSIGLLVSFDSHIFQQVVSFSLGPRNDTLNSMTCSTLLIHYKLLNVFLLSAHDLFLMLTMGER